MLGGGLMRNFEGLCLMILEACIFSCKVEKEKTQNEFLYVYMMSRIKHMCSKQDIKYQNWKYNSLCSGSKFHLLFCTGNGFLKSMSMTWVCAHEWYILGQVVCDIFLQSFVCWKIHCFEHVYRFHHADG